MGKVLAKSFFQQDTRKVARDLLGKFLARGIGNRKISAMITETEAYDGPRDRASHASRGRTERNKIMWGPPGRFYIYLCYGAHWMLNIVTRERGYPAAVLIRGLKNSTPLPLNNSMELFNGIDGPGKVTKFLKIGKAVARRLNGKMTGKKTGLWLEDRGEKIRSAQIRSGPRVGVAYAGAYWSAQPRRFYLK